MQSNQTGQHQPGYRNVGAHHAQRQPVYQHNNPIQSIVTDDENFRNPKPSNEEQWLKNSASEMKKHVAFISKTDWMFNNDTFDFQSGFPYECDYVSPNTQKGKK